MEDTRLKDFLYVNRVKQVELAKYLDVTEATMSRYVKGTYELPKWNIKKLINNDRGWDVSMFLGKSDASLPPVSISQERENLIPLIPIEAHAGYLGDYSESVMAYQCEKISVPMKGATCAIRITGDSMEPRYHSGDIAVLQKIDESIFIEWGKVYVLSTINGPVMKKVMNTDKDDVIECISLNEKYQPFTIETKYINGWYKLLGVWCFE